MESVLFLYDPHVKTLNSQGFVINPYDRRISNRTIDDKQCTISWCYDNNTVLHVYEQLNTNIVKSIA